MGDIVHDPLGPQPDEPADLPLPGGPPEPATPLVPDENPDPVTPDPARPEAEPA